MAKPYLPSLFGRGEETLGSLFRDVERVFDEFSRRSAFTFEADASAFAGPKIDVAETKDAIDITAELPGIEEKDIELTLSDGLRLPKGQNEEAFMTNDTGISRTSPFFCLLEDDSLITRWNVRTDRLLEEERDRANVQLIIEVTVKATRLTWGNIAMASG